MAKGQKMSECMFHTWYVYIKYKRPRKSEHKTNQNDPPVSESLENVQTRLQAPSDEPVRRGSGRIWKDLSLWTSTCIHMCHDVSCIMMYHGMHPQDNSKETQKPQLRAITMNASHHWEPSRIAEGLISNDFNCFWLVLQCRAMEPAMAVFAMYILLWNALQAGCNRSSNACNVMQLAKFSKDLESHKLTAEKCA